MPHVIQTDVAQKYERPNVEAKLVLKEKMREFRLKYFGKGGEKLVYLLMRHTYPAYTGGFWDYYQLDNGGGYMKLANQTITDINASAKGSRSQMSTHAAGIAISLIALSHMLLAPT